MLYTKNGSYPAPLPNRLRMSDGTTRTDSSTYTDEEIEDAGYTAVEAAPEATYPNKVEWDGSDWFVRSPNDSETYAERSRIKSYCLSGLKDTDYKVIKAVEIGQAPDPAYVTYRQALRDLYNTIDSLDPWTAVMPSLDLSESEE